MKIYSRFLVLVLGFILLGSSCNKDNNPTPSQDRNVTINCVATYGGEPLVLGKIYDYPQGFKIKVKTVDFMIHGFFLSGAGTSFTPGDSIRVMKFTDLTLDEQTAKDGISFVLKNASQNYNLLHFGIGIPAYLNDKSPIEYPNSSPLSSSEYYWDSWKSFIFMKVEGLYDLDGDGVFEGGFAYHTGTNDLYKTLDFPVNISSTDTNPKIKLGFDIKTLLAKDGDYIDIPAKPTSHSPKDKDLSIKITNNMSSAITVL